MPLAVADYMDTIECLCLPEKCMLNNPNTNYSTRPRIGPCLYQ